MSAYTVGGDGSRVIQCWVMVNCVIYLLVIYSCGRFGVVIVVFEWPALPTSLLLLRLCFFEHSYPPFLVERRSTIVTLRIRATLPVDTQRIPYRGKHISSFVSFSALFHSNSHFLIRE